MKLTPLLIVAGLSLKNLHPRVWDVTSPYYLSDLRALMVSYADFERMPAVRQKVTAQGLRAFLGVPDHISIYLDNGAFYFLGRNGEVLADEYESFISCARPDWYPIPQDFIPTPQMSDAEQWECLRRTMDVNRSYKHNGFVPVIHVSRHLDEYLDQLTSDEQLEGKRAVALGGIVPNLLRARKAMSYDVVLSSLGRTRSELRDKSLHVFGVGGTATLHLAALLGIDSVDSSGWRNRAARGIIQLPGRGDRMVANMGSWRGRAPSDDEWHTLSTCHCPACDRFGLRGLSASGLVGFCHRATHNLWTLLQEAQSIEFHLSSGDYESWYMSHVDNSIYRPLIECVLKNQQLARNASQNATSISGLEKTL